MKKQMLLAGMLAVTVNAHAADAAPEICKSIASYAVQAIDKLRFTDGTWSDAYNPKSIRLRKDEVKYPVLNSEFLGNCDDDSATNVKMEWCKVAGGSPDVYKLDVGQTDTGGTYDAATVIVTFNRGGCFVDEVIKK